MLYCTGGGSLLLWKNMDNCVKLFVAPDEYFMIEMWLSVELVTVQYLQVVHVLESIL